MSANLRRYTTILFGFEHVLRMAPEEAWSNPSPCEGWTARDVAGHAMAVTNNIAGRAGVVSPPLRGHPASTSVTTKIATCLMRAT